MAGEPCVQAYTDLVPTKSCPTRWRHQSILCMPDESTRLGSDTELTRRPTRSTRFSSQTRVRTRGYVPKKIVLVLRFHCYFERAQSDDLVIVT